MYKKKKSNNIRINYLNISSSLRIALTFLLLVVYFSSLVSAKINGEYIIDVTENVQNENIVLNNTTIIDDHIEILNGWNPSNKWWGTSGGVMDKLDNSTKKLSICFTAPSTQNVSSIGIVSYASENPPIYKIGLQLDDGSGNPDGSYIDGQYGTIQPIGDNQLNYGTFPNSVKIEKGQKYHIVVEHHSGVIDSSHYARLKGMTNGISKPVGWIAYNYNGYDPDIAYKDPNYTSIFFNGVSWSYISRNSPNFILNFENGEHFGGLQLHNYRGVFGNTFAGERILIHNQNKTVNQISSYFWSERTVDVDPNDHLYYEIQDKNRSVLRSGILINKEEFHNESTHWWTADLSAPLKLEVGEIYYIIFKSPASNSTSYYNHDASGPIYHPDWTINTTYGGRDAYCIRSLDGGLSWTEYLKNDYSFGLKLCEIFSGEVTLIAQNAESITSQSKVWKQIKLNGSVPECSSLDLYIKSSSDNKNFSEWNLMEENAKSNTTYGIKTINQEKYIALKLVLKTNDPLITPKVGDIFLYTDDTSVSDNETPFQEIEFSPVDSTLTRNVSEKVNFSVSPDVFTTKAWYINGCLIQNNTTSIIRCWSAAGTYNVTFSGSTGKEPVLHTWTVNVTEEQKNQNESIIKVDPEYQVVEPKKPFNLSIKIKPETLITGTQLDFAFNSSMTSVINVTEGDLLKQSGAYTIFSSGTIDNSAGAVKNVYGFILGTSNVSSPGTMATINLTAGNRTGMAKFGLSNVIISDANSKSVPYTVTNATVLIDTAPVIAPIEPKSVKEKSNLAFKVSAKDADGDRLVLTASGVPQGAVFNTTSGNFTWMPERGQAGVYTITFKVSDGYLTDSESVTVTVNKLNNPPIIRSFEPLNGSSFSEGEMIGISVNASDAEGQALNYSIRIDEVVYTTDTEYLWETDYSSSGNHTIEAIVSDGIDEVKAQRTIFISDCHPRWDVNEDGVVNILDITRVSQAYGTTVNKPYPRHDVNQDGNINILDLTMVGNHFGEYVK